MLKFTFHATKMKKADLSRARGHNLREHPTDSQLPKFAWLTEKGQHTAIEWNEERAELARSLAKRKDAVVGVQLIFQIGNQMHWREKPTKENPYGAAKAPPYQHKKMAEGIINFLTEEFGKENIVSLELHTDESTPHWHAIVTPIKDGKLNAKNWLNGPETVAKLRERAHKAVSKSVPCTYTKGNRTRTEFDPSMAAGGINSPYVTEMIEENEAMRDEISRLLVDVQRLEQIKALRDELDATRDALDGLRRENGLLRGRIKEIEAEALKTAPTSVQKAVFRVPKAPGL